jgi:hypothetical protein
MAHSPKNTLLPNSQKMILCIVKLFDKSFKLKAPTTIAFYNHPTLHVPTNTSFPLHTLFSPPALHPLFASLTLELTILVISFAIPLPLNSTSVSRTPYPCVLYISFPFGRGAPRADWPELTVAASAHRLHHLRHNPPLLGHYHCRA